MSETLVGVLTYPDGYKIELRSDPNKVGRRERVYAALHAARSPELVQSQVNLFVRYQPRRDKFSLIAEGGVDSITVLRASIKLEENAALEQLEKLGCIYAEYGTSPGEGKD